MGLVTSAGGGSNRSEIGPAFEKMVGRPFLACDLVGSPSSSSQPERAQVGWTSVKVWTDVPFVNQASFVSDIGVYAAEWVSGDFPTAPAAATLVGGQFSGNDTIIGEVDIPLLQTYSAAAALNLLGAAAPSSAHSVAWEAYADATNVHLRFLHYEGELTDFSIGWISVPWGGNAKILYGMRAYTDFGVVSRAATYLRSEEPGGWTVGSVGIG